MIRRYLDISLIGRAIVVQMRDAKKPEGEASPGVVAGVLEYYEIEANGRYVRIALRGSPQPLMIDQEKIFFEVFVEKN